jgi:hypothetical protein
MQREQQVGECWVCVILFARLDLVFATLRQAHRGFEGGPLAPPFGGSGVAPSINIFFSLGNVSHFFLVFCVASIFMSMVGRLFGTWLLLVVFYFRLRN